MSPLYIIYILYIIYSFRVACAMSLFPVSLVSVPHNGKHGKRFVLFPCCKVKTPTMLMAVENAFSDI